MQHLLQPRVLRSAIIAAAITALASYPRLSLWLNRPPLPMWYLELAIFLCCITLWGFVFAWHEPYVKRPVFEFKQERATLILATVTGLVTAAADHLCLDPSLRSVHPEEYPQDIQQWVATLPFALAFNQLFLIFAPFDWLMRLVRNRWIATAFVAVLNTVLLMMSLHRLSASLPAPILAVLLAERVVSGFLAGWFYLRGGIILVSWWTFLNACRYILPSF